MQKARMRVDKNAEKAIHDILKSKEEFHNGKKGKTF